MLSKIFWKSLLVTPAILGAALLSSSAIAAEVTSTSDSADALLTDAAPEASAVAEVPAFEAPIQVSQVPVSQPEATTNVATLDQIMQYSNEGRGVGSLAQVTSVTQFSDVSPSDWAYEALSFLANSEELGGLDCLEGYPDGTYRGSRPLTRYEFAAGLASCLDAIEERILAGGGISPEALERIEALQREFAAELAALRSRVDALEAAVAELEENQFSTTTKLRGETIFAFSDIFGGENLDIGEDNNTVFQSRVRLNFDTSFTGEDRLRARLQWGDFQDFNNIPSSSIIPAGDVFDDQSDYSFDTNTEPEVEISRLEYYFPLGGATVYLGAYGEGISDIVTTVSPFDDPAVGSLSYFGYNPIYDLGEQNIGFGITYDLSESLQIGAGYLTGEGNSPDPGAGLFNGGYTAFGQLTFSPGDLTVALTYVNAYTSFEGTGLFGLDSSPTVFNAYGLSANYRLAETISLGGWISYIDSRTFAGPTELLGDGRSWTYALTLGFEDLGLEGSLLGFVVGVPPYNAIYDYAVGGAFGSDAALHVEGFYVIPVSDNIYVTPGVIWVSDPGNNNDNDSIFIGALRTAFRF